MSTSAQIPTDPDADRITASLRPIEPALQGYRNQIQAAFLSALANGRDEEAREFDAELTAFDRWRSFELGRQESRPRDVVKEQQ